jgi:molybdopterin-guanine dinucleotide biosynthesis protein A
MTGVILAGGRSTRMGRNKAFLEVGGERLIDRNVRLFRSLFQQVIIVTTSPLDYLDQPAAIATDILPGRGALGGIYTGLFHASGEQAFFAACDMPFLNPDFLACMIGLAAGHDIVVPAPPDGLQPLHAIYSRRCLPVIRSLLERDRLKIRGFYPGFDVLTIPPETLQAFDPEGRMFLNVNTPADLRRLAAP